MSKRFRLMVPMLCFGVATGLRPQKAPADSISFADTLLALQPISYWRLGDLAGNTALDQTGVSNGTYHNATLGQPGALINDPDTSVRFWEFSPSFLEIPHSDQYLLDNGTVLLSFRDDGSINDTGLFSKDSRERDQGGHLNIGTTSDGRIEVRLQSTDGDFFVNSEPFIELDKWFNVAFTFGAEGMKLYINGALVDTNPYTGGTGTTSGGTGNTEPIVVGASGALSDPDGQVFPLSQYFSGFLDEVALFGEALTPEQIHDLHAPEVVPEPATAGLLILGFMTLLRPRQRNGR